MFEDDKQIRFELATPERVVLKEEIIQVTVPTKEGQITVLPKHMPIIGILVPGVLEIVNTDKEKKIVSVSGGFVEVLLNKVVVLADTAERSEEIDLERAKQAREWAEEQMKKKRQETAGEEEFSQVIAEVEKQLARIKVAEKHYRGSSVDNNQQ